MKSRIHTSKKGLIRLPFCRQSTVRFLWTFIAICFCLNPVFASTAWFTLKMWEFWKRKPSRRQPIIFLESIEFQTRRFPWLLFRNWERERPKTREYAKVLCLVSLWIFQKGLHVSPELCTCTLFLSCENIFRQAEVGGILDWKMYKSSDLLEEMTN